MRWARATVLPAQGMGRREGGLAVEDRALARRVLRAAARRFPRSGRAAVGVVREARHRSLRAYARAGRTLRSQLVTGLLDSVRGLLAPDRPRSVVLLATESLTARELDGWLEDLHADSAQVFCARPAPAWRNASRARVSVHRVIGTDGVARKLVPMPPVDVIVDLVSDDGPAALHRYHELFWHLGPGGVYVIAGSKPADPLDEHTRKWLGVLASGVVGVSAPGFPTVPAELVRSVTMTVVDAHSALIIKANRHLLKVRDAESDLILPTRDPSLDVVKLAVRPAGSFEARDTVVHHVADVPVSWPPSSIAYPQLNLRHYRGSLVYRSHTLAHTDRTILPECFRWHLIDNPTNPTTVNASARFARVPDDAAATEELAGDFYQLDPQHGGYGHVMTETVGRLWGWDEAKRQIPGLKAVFSVKWPKQATRSPKYQVLRAYGIAAEDIVWTDRPVRIKSLVGATDMWHNNVPYYVQPDLSETWHRIGSGLIDPAAPIFDKIFVSRGPRYRRRSCRNAEQVEEVFRSHGFEIIYPEDWTMPQQAGLFAGARVIAGFGGSGLFNILFARNLEVGIFLNQDSYYHRNEHLFTSLLGGTIHYFWSPADLEQDTSGQNLAASQSSWEFAFDRHEADLRRLLASV